MTTPTGYQRSNSTQGAKVKVATTICPDRIIRVSVDCPRCGRVSDKHDGAGRAAAEAYGNAAWQAHADHTKTI